MDAAEDVDSILRVSAREMTRAALNAGGKIALDSAIRVVGKLVEEFTVRGHQHEAAGASAAMEMLKRMQSESVCPPQRGKE